MSETQKKHPEQELPTSLILYSYDERLFPEIFRTTAKSSIVEALSTPSEVAEIFYTEFPPVPSLDKRKILLRKWFRFFDEVFFKGGLSRPEIKLNNYMNFEEPSPPLPPGVNKSNVEGYFWCQPKSSELYIYINKTFNKYEDLVWKGDWSGWAISVLLHEYFPPTQALIEVLADSLYRMLHAFFHYYSKYPAEYSLPASEGGTGLEGHGRPFLNSLYYLDNALREAVLDKAPRKFELHARLRKLALSSMLSQNWRPYAHEIETMRNWGFPEDVAELLTTGAWSDPKTIPLSLEIFDKNSRAKYTMDGIPIVGSNDMASLN